MTLAPDAGLRRFHWTREVYHRAVEAGVFGDADVQLRHGEVVARVSPKGAPHAAIVQFLTKVLAVGLAQGGGDYEVRVQDPIGRTDDDEPEPDLAIVAADRDYHADHPLPADVLLLVEVADDSTLASDLAKIREYAEVGIAEVWLVDADVEAMFGPV